METVFFFWLIFVITTGAVAASKDRSVIGWVLLASVFSFLALLLLVVLPSQKPPVIVIIGDAPPKRVAMPKYYGSAHNLGFRLGKMLRRG